MSLYPNATQITPRFLRFEQNVQEIQHRQNSGGELSIEEGAALKEYDNLRDQLAFLRPPQEGAANGPVAMPRLPAAPKPSGQPESAPAPDDSDQPDIQYVGGVRIKSDYSLQEVLGITANALKSPFGSFIANAKDLVKKATEGTALTANEEQQVYQYAQIANSFWGMTGQGRIQQLAGVAVDSLNNVVGGEMPGPGQLIDDLRQIHGMGNPMAKGVSDRTVVDTKAAPRPKTNGTPRQPVLPPLNRTAPRQGVDPLYLFDFPRFKVPPSPQFPGVRPPIAAPKPFFKPPTRLETGQIGYPLSPTSGPRLPTETEQPAETEQPVAGTSRSSSVSTTETQTGETSSTGRQSPAAKSRSRSSIKAKETSPPSQRVSEQQWAVRLSGLNLKAVAGKGPINVELPGGSAEDRKRIDSFSAPFFFYRNDKDVSDMSQPRPARKTDYEDRRDVLTVGNGEDATSYAHETNVYMGRYWGHGPSTLTSDTSIIQLDNGRQGVGAIKLPFANIRRGATIVVTGGAMNGCTMLYASDGSSLYAYHAGTPIPGTGWLTAREGARSIVDAHEKIGPHKQARFTPQNNNHDLVVMGRQYPFSALIYSARDLANAGALAGAGSVASAIAGAALPNATLNVPSHAYGPREGARWHMMTFNYFEPDDKLRSVGTAEAVIHKDMNGAVTVSVLAEKGSLDKTSSVGERGGPISYKYTPILADSAIYTVPAPPASR